MSRRFKYKRGNTIPQLTPNQLRQQHIFENWFQEEQDAEEERSLAPNPNNSFRRYFNSKFFFDLKKDDEGDAEDEGDTEDGDTKDEGDTEDETDGPEIVPFWVNPIYQTFISRLTPAAALQAYSTSFFTALPYYQQLAEEYVKTNMQKKETPVFKFETDIPPIVNPGDTLPPMFNEKMNNPPIRLSGKPSRKEFAKAFGPLPPYKPFTVVEAEDTLPQLFNSKTYSLPSLSPDDVEAIDARKASMARPRDNDYLTDHRIRTESVQRLDKQYFRPSSIFEDPTYTLVKHRRGYESVPALQRISPFKGRQTMRNIFSKGEVVEI